MPFEIGSSKGLFLLLPISIDELFLTKFLDPRCKHENSSIITSVIRIEMKLIVKLPVVT